MLARRALTSRMQRTARPSLDAAKSSFPRNDGVDVRRDARIRSRRARAGDGKNGANPERPLAPAPAAAVVTLMLTRIVCPNCGHIGAASAASLPRVLICSQCGHGAFIKSSRPAKGQSVARDEQAACALLGSGMRRRASPQGRGRNNFRAFLVGRTSRRPAAIRGSCPPSERRFAQAVAGLGCRQTRFPPPWTLGMRPAPAFSSATLTTRRPPYSGEARRRVTACVA
jgi:hypothetical protein